MADIRDERPHVDVVERRALVVEPAAELVHVEPVRAACPVRQRGRVEKACGSRVRVHEPVFDGTVAQPPLERAVLSG
jgi:hypothetical protein